MELLFIYGAPGVGKLTVAEEVSKKTGMKIFHNHLTFDFASSFFEPFSKEFNMFREELMVNSLKALVKQEINGLILTYCYTKEDLPFINKIQEICTRENINISYVLLTCDANENLKRVVNEERKKYKKLVDEEIWKNINNNYNLSEFIPDVQVKTINNTDLSPENTADLIVDSFQYEIKK